MDVDGAAYPMKVNIRNARPADQDHLIQCLDAMHDRMVELDPWDRLARAPNHGSMFLRKLRREVRQNGGFILVAEANGRPAAAALAYVRRFSSVDRTTERPTRMGFLSDLSVLPAWRGRGIGTRLLREVESRFRRIGCDQISLGVFFPNKAAQRLYRRVGFSPRGMFMVKRLRPGPKQWPAERRPVRRNPQRTLPRPQPRK